MSPIHCIAASSQYPSKNWALVLPADVACPASTTSHQPSHCEYFGRARVQRCATRASAFQSTSRISRPQTSVRKFHKSPQDRDTSCRFHKDASCCLRASSAAMAHSRRRWRPSHCATASRWVSRGARHRLGRRGSCRGFRTGTYLDITRQSGLTFSAWPCPDKMDAGHHCTTMTLTRQETSLAVDRWPDG
jgi:hypothetical protein